MFTRMSCLVAVVLVWAWAGTALAEWTGTNSTQWDDAANWGGVLPSGGTSNAQIEGYDTPAPGFGWPVIDSGINTYWGVCRVRGPGLHLTQTGGRHEWPNGSGRSSKGFTIFSRPAAYPTGAGPDNPCVVILTGGTMLTDQVGLGMTGGLNSGSFYTDGVGGDYTLDTGEYKNWQSSPTENPPRNGWGRLEITGDATFIVRPNRFVFPTGYTETTPYWSFNGGPATDPRPFRLYNIGISRQSKMIVSGNGRLIAPLKIYYNANDLLADRDVLAQLYYYAGLVQAGTTPHYVPEIRFAAGDGETLQFQKYPGVVNGSLWGGYFTVTATTGTPHWLTAVPQNAQAAIALEGSLTPNPTIEPYFVVNADPIVPHTMDIVEVDANGDEFDYDWLSLSASSLNVPPSSDLSCTVMIDHVTPALAPGLYTAYVKFSDASDPAHVTIRQIQLSVLGCQWAVAPASRNLARYYISGSGDPVGSVAFAVENTGKPDLVYVVAKVPEDATTDWLTLDKTGNTPPGLDYQATETATATIDVTGLAVGDHTCTVRFTNGCSPADVVDYTVTLHVLPSNHKMSATGLLAYYRFEDSLRDWTGNGYDGVVAGGSPSYVESDDGRGIRFDGPASGDGVDLGAIPSPSDTGSKAMTMALWFRSEDMPADTWLIAKSEAPGGAWKGWHIKLAREGGLPVIDYIWCHDGLRETLASSTPTGLYDGDWHLIAMTIEDVGGGNVNVRGYYDGQLLGEAANSSFVPASAALDVQLSVSSQTPTQGDVDGLSLWNRALSSEEIAYIHENGFVDTRPWPDADEDGDVDMNDFAVFQRCYSGDLELTNPETCQRFDRNGDDRVGEVDLNRFEACGTGPDVPLDLQNLPLDCDL